MIRLGVAMDWLDLGGMESVCLQLLSRIDRSRFDPHVYAFRPGRLADDFRRLDVPVSVAYDKAPDDRTWTEADSRAVDAYLPGLCEALRRDRIEVLVVWGWKDGVEAGRMAGVPAIVERLDGPTLVSRVRDKSGCVRVIAESEAVMRMVRAQHELLRLDPASLVVIPNAVDTARFDASRFDRAECRAALGYGADDLVIGSVARLAPEKNLIQLVDALQLLRERTRVPERTPVRGLLVGPDGGSRADLERRVAEHGLGGAIRILGAQDDVARVLATLDVFCLPSLYEGTPSAMLEAMAMGLPIAATPVGAVAEVIDGNGFLVAQLDPYGLALALEELCLDADLRRRLGARSRELALGMDIGQAVDAYESVFEDALAIGLRSRA